MATTDALFPDLELDYKNVREANHALAYFAEAFLNGPELVQLALSILNFDFEGEQKAVVANLKAIVEKYANLDLEIDKEVFTAMLKWILPIYRNFMVRLPPGMAAMTRLMWTACMQVRN